MESNEKLRKLEKHNEVFKNLLKNSSENTKLEFLDDIDLDDWRLCSAYIDGLIAAACRVDYILDESVSIAFSVLDNFIGTFEEVPMSGFIRDFQKLLTLLFLRKWQSMGFNLSPLNVEGLEEEFWIKPY